MKALVKRLLNTATYAYESVSVKITHCANPTFFNYLENCPRVRIKGGLTRTGSIQTAVGYACRTQLLIMQKYNIQQSRKSIT